MNVNFSHKNDIRENNISPEKHNILLVEDCPEMIKTIQLNLCDQYNIYIAYNGKNALQRLEQIPKPQIIISDIIMDEMDGITFYKELLKTENMQDIPFIFLTAKPSFEDKIRSLKQGAIDYIQKPFYMDELKAKINAIIQHQIIKKALYEKDKYASLGMLISGISHEIFNPLSGISAPLANLERLINGHSLKDHPKVKEYIQTIEENVDRIKKVILTLKRLYYKKDFEKETLNIKDIARSVISIYAKNAGSKINLTYQGKNDFTIYGNHDALVHILINLVTNAIDAIHEQGEIIIKTEKNNRENLIIVRDTGSGIPENKLRNIFNAYYTTKEVGKGTGLGLYIVKDLVLQMNWQIEVFSQFGQGTQFTIKIPHETIN